MDGDERDEYTFAHIDALGRAYPPEPGRVQPPVDGYHPYDHYTHGYQQSHDYYNAPGDEYMHEPQQLDSFGPSSCIADDQPC